MLCVWLKVLIKPQSENSWLPAHCAPCSLHWLVKLHSHKACKVLTQHFRFITTGSVEYLFRQRWTETKLVLTWKLCCISAPEHLALIVTFVPRSKHHSARRRLRDRITCCHFLGMIRMFLSKHVGTVRVMSSPLVVSIATAMCFLSLLIQKSQLDSRWSTSAVTLIRLAGFGWKNASGYVREQTHLHVSWFAVSATRLQWKCWREYLKPSSHDLITTLPFVFSHELISYLGKSLGIEAHDPVRLSVKSPASVEGLICDSKGKPPYWNIYNMNIYDINYIIL